MIMFLTLPFIHIFMLGYIVTVFPGFGKYFIVRLHSGKKNSGSLI